MTLLDEIRECFAATKQGKMRQLENLSSDFPAWIIKRNRDFGAAIEYNGPIVNESFSNCKIRSEELPIGGNFRLFLILTCSQEELRYEFASVCAQFVDPGENGKDRERLLSNPTEWWERWRSLMGNAVVERQVYSVIAEMLVLNHLFRTDKTIEWTASKVGSKDIENPKESFEVKSTVVRYGSLIKISGQFQLLQSKPLHLFFCRMEQSPTGYSIDDVKETLVANGYNQALLETELENLGFEAGTSNRKKKYKILEIREYNVDDDFPKITQDSFANRQMPAAIVQLSYTLNLDAVEKYKTIDL